MSIESEILSNHLIFCGPLLFLPSIFPSIRVFSNDYEHGRHLWKIRTKLGEKLWLSFEPGQLLFASQSLSFLTCKVRLRNTYLIGAVMRIRGVNIAKYLTQGLFVVQLLSPVWLFAIPWTAACQASLSFTVSWSLLKLMFVKMVERWVYLKAIWLEPTI